MSEPLKNLAQAVVAVMGEMESLPKDGTNSFQNYNYTTEAMVANTIRPLLVKNGLALIPHNISITENHPVEKKLRVLISATYMLLHTSGESMTITVPGEGMDSLDKSTTKALTAAFKYAMLQMFCVGRGDDGDEGKGYGTEAIMDRQVTEMPKQSENSAVRAAATRVEGYVFTFGKHSGSPITSVPTDYIKWLLEKTEKDILDPSKAGFKTKNKEMLDRCLREIQRRSANAREDADITLEEAPF